MKILVIQQKMIGDVLTSSLVCENLKRNYPKAEVHYLINRFTLPVVENHPFIDEFIIFEDAYRQSKIKFYKFLKHISKANYTHVFDAYGKLESLFTTRFSKAKYRYGFKKSYSAFYYTKTVAIQHVAQTEAGTAIENRLRLLQLMPKTKIFNNKPKIYLTQEEKELAKVKMKNVGLEGENCIMISALGSNDLKTYPLQYMAKILDDIVKATPVFLILNYMPVQQSKIEALINYCSQETQNKIVTDVDMTSLRDFMGICKQCIGIIGNEGGAINIAKALDVPSFSIFSPWITKEGWNSFEETHLNFSVHLKDYYSNIYKKNSKKYKNETEAMYIKLKPKLFKTKLALFLDLLLKHER
ncbi:glycosyltransferase family 9 protein [Flavobacterium sp. CS20]|uniref:glycosyltransferase family 9 protein n=1 Tax=Flavobacterium sp. CS20 TaxID=2775246 RepID=UPI001B39E407|nr:glycosyltransferase family 9 protein [Flavobacterium sp. CS20]QTY27463.1 glycosyltransferase family 9 protein [Flavobacterium sp. CS20]